MNVRFLGTGYGECKVKKRSSKDFRRPASLIVDERIVIDPSPEAFEFADAFSLDGLFDRVDCVLITHSHPSHFCKEAIEKLASIHPITVCGSESVLSMLQPTDAISLCPLTPGEQVTLGDHRILPVPANHATDCAEEMCFWYRIERERALFYAVDGGMPTAIAHRLLREWRVDVWIADCALADAAPNGACFSHGCLQTVALTRDILRADGILSERGRTVLTHIPTDRRAEIHAALSAAARERDMVVAYDGYFLNV